MQPRLVRPGEIGVRARIPVAHHPRGANLRTLPGGLGPNLADFT